MQSQPNPQQFANEIEPLNRVVELNLLTQDEQQMVQAVKRHHFENRIISFELVKQLSTITRNMQNVRILCQGDAA